MQPQIIQLQAPSVQNQAQAGNQGGIQIVQQIVTPSGEIQQIPVINRRSLKVFCSMLFLCRFNWPNPNWRPLKCSSRATPTSPSLSRRRRFPSMHNPPRKSFKCGHHPTLKINRWFLDFEFDRLAQFYRYRICISSRQVFTEAESLKKRIMVSQSPIS